MKDINILDLTIIIPVHTVSDFGEQKFNDLFEMALSSVNNNAIKPEKVLIVTCECKEVTDHLATLDLKKYDLEIEIIINTGETDYQSQVNFASKQVTTKYMSVLEFDDELTVTWFKNVNQYILAYPDVDMFLPIINDVTSENELIGLSNEAIWAYNFSEKMGYLDLETLLEYPNISPTGMVIKTNTYNSIKGFKSLKLTFNYEFLLRFLKNGHIAMVIPKIGYKHVNMRPGSLFWLYKNSESIEDSISPEEARFWVETAKKEYLFTDDRAIIYDRSHEI